MSLARQIGGPIPVDRVAQSRLSGVDFATVAFSSIFSDHMFSAEYDGNQWTGACIKPYGPIALQPSISALHYGVSVFEGLKVHRASNGTPLVFRAEENARRLQRSAARPTMAMPSEVLWYRHCRDRLAHRSHSISNGYDRAATRVRARHRPGGSRQTARPHDRSRPGSLWMGGVNPLKAHTPPAAGIPTGVQHAALPVIL